MYIEDQRIVWLLEAHRNYTSTTICCHTLQKLTMGKDSEGQNITKDDADKLYSLFRKGPHKGGLN